MILRDEEVVTLRDAIVVADSIVGTAERSPRRVASAVADVERVEVRALKDTGG